MSDQAGTPGGGFWANAAGERALQRYSTLVNMVDDSIYQLDAEGRFVAVNDTIVELTGYSREELLSEHASLVIADEDVSRIQDEISRRLTDDDRRDERIEFTARTADGDTIPCELELHLLVRDNTFQGTIGVVRDITERTERERELRETKHQLEITLEGTNTGIWEWDLTTDEVIWSETLDRLLGMDPGEFEGTYEAFLERLHPDDRPDVKAALNEAVGDDEFYRAEFRMRHKNGEWRWFESRSRAVSDGDHDRVVGIRQDVTERKEREQALQESRNQLRALIDVLPVGVFVAEANGKIVEWNEAAEEIWGGEVAEAESVAEYAEYEAWWVDTGEPVDPNEWPMARALEGEEVTDPDEIKIKGFDGEFRTVLNHGMPVRDADGEVSRAVVTLVDITERKEHERKLEASNERLEQFAYAASHDLQEPLRMVSSHLQLIERRYADELDENAREFIEFAVDGADRMRNMIEGLLQYSRVETQGDPFEPVDLDDVLIDVRSDLQVKIEETDADVTAESLPIVDGDRGQLRQLFQNLLDNAIEYSVDGLPVVHVEAERAGDEYVLSVSDEGIGIDPGEADRVFEVFQSLHTTDEYSGVGIGLALCKRIVERHGGDIWVDSEPGGGTTFSFTLPTVGETN